MAIQLDPNIALQARPLNILGSISEGVRVGGMLEQLRQSKEEAPIRQELLNQKAQQGERLIQEQQAQAALADQNRVIDSIANTYSGVKSLVDTGKFNDAADALEANKEVLRQSGVTNFEDSDLAINALRSGDAKAIRQIQLQGEQAIQMSEARRGAESSERFSPTTTTLPGGISIQTTSTGRKVVTDAGGNTLAGQAATDAITEAEEAKAARQVDVATRKEVNKLSAQLKLKPEVESAVFEAVEGAKATAEAAQTQKSNEVALNVYDTAMSGLVESLGGTTTGPGAGFLPAITADAQIANGAIAAMAPVLKQMFRGAGEGTFTDKDQELLLAMIPTRNDLPEAREAKIKNIDAIVRAKLGTQQPAAIAQPAQPSQAIDTGVTAEQFRAMTPEQRAATLQQLRSGQ